MVKTNESEVKRVRPQSERTREPEKRDPTLEGGERAETESERLQREEERRRPKEAPIIQKDIT